MGTGYEYAVSAPAPLVGYPLTILGGIMGKNLTRPFEAPVRTKQIPREIPQLAFYKSPFFTAVIGVQRYILYRLRCYDGLYFLSNLNSMI